MMIQAGLPIMDFGSMQHLAEHIPWEQQIGNSLIVREPVGVVGAITPWNYPLHQIAAKVRAGDGRPAAPSCSSRARSRR